VNNQNKDKNKKSFKYWKPDLEQQTTTLWEYPSQHYGDKMQGNKGYIGATPSYVIWNLLERYTEKGDKVLDPMCGSGTTLDVCSDMERIGVGFDLQPQREEITLNDARSLPLEDNSIDFAFIDPPYSTHVEYSQKDECIGELDALDPEYYNSMTSVIEEMTRVLKPGKYLGLYVSDSYRKNKPFCAIGFDLFSIMRQQLIPVDIVAVTRHNKNLKKFNWHKAAIEGNYFLRGFNYLFIMKKPEETKEEPVVEKKLKGRAKKRFFERKKFLEQKSTSPRNYRAKKKIAKKATSKKKFS
jgi:adenine-specific DNA-methyltransferase